MTQGYLLLGVGKRYILENSFLAKTIRKQGDNRPISILINSEDEEYAKSFDCFTDTISYDVPKNDKVYNDCNNAFEVNCVYPRLNLNHYSNYDQTINLDSDVLCQYSTENLWKYLTDGKFSVANLGNKVADPNWHWGHSRTISQIVGKNIPSMHCGFNYFKRDSISDSFYESTKSIFLKYDNYGCKRFFRGSRTEEAVYSLTYTELDISPIGYTEFPIMTFNYTKNEILPKNEQVLLDENNRRIALEGNIPFIHMFEKMEGENFQALYKQIMEK
jgi:hypothetical protein